MGAVRTILSTSSREKTVTDRAWLFLLLGLSACGDDAAATGTSGGSSTSASTGSAGCIVSIHDGTDVVCSAECPGKFYGSSTSICTVSCTGPEDACPEGTACLPNLFGKYSACLPPCENGVCPEKLRCSTDGVRCEPL